MSTFASDLVALASERRTAASRAVLALLALNIIAPGVADDRGGL